MLSGDEVALGRGAVAGEARRHTVNQERLGREGRTQSGSVDSVEDTRGD